MDLKEIQTRLDALAVAMADKGLLTPSVVHMVYSGERVSVMIEWGQYPKNRYETFPTLDKAEAHVAALPSPDEHHRNEFLRRVGDAADYGRQHGIDSDFVNPLTEAMKRLSANAIAAE